MAGGDSSGGGAARGNFIPLKICYDVQRPFTHTYNIQNVYTCYMIYYYDLSLIYDNSNTSIWSIELSGGSHLGCHQRECSPKVL